MKNLFKLGITLLLVVFVSSCTEDSYTIQEQKLNLEAYSQLKVQLKNDLNVLANELSQVTNKGMHSEVLDIAKTYYGESSRQFNAFNQSFSLLHNSNNARTSSEYNLTDYQSEQVNLIIGIAEGFNSLPELKSYLNQEFERYANSNISIEDKNFVLTFISSFEVSFEFINDNPESFQEYVSNGRIQGFWGCVAGITGGVAVTTAVVGAVINPPLWVLAASEWYLVASAGAASIATIAAEC